VITARARLLALASAGGAALGHLLDELGALPGVHESATTRLAVLDPARAPGIALALLGTVAAGLLVDRALRRSTALAVGVLVCCQLLVAAGLESVARGRLEIGALENGGSTAVLVQLGVALLVVALASLTALALTRLPRPRRLLSAPTRPPLPLHGAGTPFLVDLPCQGRAPPSGVAWCIP
jgi:hypothetical protein